MDNIPYPRQLNKPTYLVWRFTHHDLAHAAIVMACCMLVSNIFEGLPTWITIGPIPGFLLYRGCVVALKPRGWDAHVLKSLRQPKKLNPGHFRRRLFIVPDAPKSQGKLAFIIKLFKNHG